MTTISVALITILLGAIFSLLAYIGKKTIAGVESLHKTLSKIELNVAEGVINHDNLEKRVDKLENKIYE